MKKFSLLLLLPILLLAESVDQSCPDGLLTFDYSGDVNKEIYFPNNTGQYSHPEFPKNFTCDFQINVPERAYARITLIVYGLPKNYRGQAPVQLIDKLSGVEEVYSTQKDQIIRIYSLDFTTYYFIADGGRIKLRTGQNDIHFGFNLRYDEYPRLSRAPIQNRVSYSDRAPFVYNGQASYDSHLVTADTRVSASVVVEKNIEDHLRAVLFFDGPDWNSKLLGTGYTLLKNKTQFVSTENTMTIVSMYLGWLNAHIVLQDYENTKDIVEFQGIKCRRGEDCKDVILDGTNGPAVLQSINPSDMYSRSNLIDVITKIEGDGKLDVHIGGRMRNGKNVIASYSANSTNLPQLFFGRIKTYIVTGGKLKIHISRILNDFQNQTIGGNGFISSFDYGHTSKNQGSYSEILVPKKAIIRIKIRDIDLSGSTKLILTGYRDGSLVYLENLDYSQPGLSAGEAFNTTNNFFYGEKLDVHYKTGGGYSDGFYMEFAIEKSSYLGFDLLSFLMVSVFMFVFS